MKINKSKINRGSKKEVSVIQRVEGYEARIYSGKRWWWWWKMRSRRRRGMNKEMKVYKTAIFS